MLHNFIFCGPNVTTGVNEGPYYKVSVCPVVLCNQAAVDDTAVLFLYHVNSPETFFLMTRINCGYHIKSNSGRLSLARLIM